MRITRGTHDDTRAWQRRGRGDRPPGLPNRAGGSDRGPDRPRPDDRSTGAPRGKRKTMTDAQRYQLSQLRTLEAEAVFIFREVVAEFERPVLLFSGGKDSIVMLRLAEKAFWPARIPFPVMHVDTGHNFQEVLDFRDRRVEELGVQLVVASVQEAIDNGTVSEPPDGTRNRIQTPVLLEALEK